MDDKQFYTIIMRHDTSTQWAVNNPILTLGEYAVEDDTHRVKRGDGETEWNDLPYEEFGLVYLITYENLSGEVSDNEALQEALDKKMSLKVFEDVDYNIVSDINIIGEDGAIGKLTKISKDIDTARNTSDIVLIKSSDNSVQGYWSSDTTGVRLLNLRAACTITDYEAGRKYYKDHLCFYQNRLYRAVEDFEAERDFDANHWVILASKHAEDIFYNNLASELDADTVQGAVDELKRRNDTKLTKSTEHKVVYATTNTGAQTVIPVDDLRTVDTVNGIAATDQVGKNIQIDASNINYDDNAQKTETIKEKLDQKVDKLVAGEGAKIVRDIQFNYNSETGHITLVEDKVSLEDGSSDEEEVEIDVVSEQELANEVLTLNTRITNEVNTLNGRIDTEVSDLNDRIDNEVDTLDTRITTEVGTLNTRINNEVATLNTTINTLDSKVDAQVNRLDGRIDNLTEVVANNKTDIESKLTNAQTTINNRIDAEVLTLNNTITTKENSINDRIDTEVSTLNTRIDTEVNTLDTRITTEVSTLNDRIDTEVADLTAYVDAQDDLKIDKDIADSIVTLLDVATHDSQPTIRITNKNTRSKNTTYDYVHFGTAGLIKTRMADADHLIIDSTDIDTINTQQNDRLTNAESRLDAHDSSIASLLEHDVNHDRTLATHTSQIANHETRLAVAEQDIDDLETALDNEITNRTTADTNLSTRIADNAVRIANNTQAIRDNADSIDQLAQTLEDNVEALANSKAEKTFASATNNKVIGELVSDTIANNELIKLTKTYVSPVNGTSTTESIRIISSDNTVIATRQQDGTIDLATNLDIDVNYFIYIGDDEQDGLSDIIGTTQTVPFSKIVAVTKQGLELNDIVTDIHGVWGRVQSIDTTNETAEVISFNKSGDAAWGHIKGSLANQTDLKALLDGMQTQINNLIDDLNVQVQSYEQGGSYTVNGHYTNQNYVTFTRNDGVMLMAKVLVAFTADDTETDTYESFKSDVNAGNLQLVGIPEQVGGISPSPTPEQEYQDTMNILNQVDGQSDTYDGLGGTEAEVEEILDDILGN